MKLRSAIRRLCVSFECLSTHGQIIDENSFNDNLLMLAQRKEHERLRLTVKRRDLSIKQQRVRQTFRSQSERSQTQLELYV